jgi:hypothetical protein
MPDSTAVVSFDPTDFIIIDYYRIVFGLPIVFAALQMMMLMSCFRYDTPVALKKSGNWEDLTKLMTKMYDNK